MSEGRAPGEATMRAAVLHAGKGAPEYGPFPEPLPGEGEVRVRVRAAGLHPVVKALAAGTHYGSTARRPLVPGVDGVGRLDDGRRVYFGFPRPPHGTLAEQSVVPRAMCLPLPADVDDVQMAALANPGISAWLALTWRAALVPGETVLVLGATGAAGQLAVQLARRFGAGRVVAAGRNPGVLARLGDLGADATVSLDVPEGELPAAFAGAAGGGGIHVIVDYLWGRPTEAALAAVGRSGLTHVAPRVRLVEIGESAGPTISLPAALLRGSGVELYGSGAGTAPLERIAEIMPRFLAAVAGGELRLDVEAVPLADVATAWEGPAPAGRRLVLVP